MADAVKEFEESYVKYMKEYVYSGLEYTIEEAKKDPEFMKIERAFLTCDPEDIVDGVLELSFFVYAARQKRREAMEKKIEEWEPLTQIELQTTRAEMLIDKYADAIKDRCIYKPRK